MELDNLKYIWRTMEHTPDREQKDAQIIALLGKRSRGPVASMRRSLAGELVLMLVTYIPAAGYYLFEFGGRLSGMAWLLFLLMAFFGAYYYRKNKLLKAMQCLTCQVRSNLERQVRMLQKYTSFYTVAGTLLIPITAIGCFLLIHWKFPQPPGPGFFSGPPGAHWWKMWLSWLIVLAPVTTGIYYFNAWYVNRLYGRHIVKLKQLLQEMGE